MISGVVVASRPEDAEAVREALSDRPWAEVHYTDQHGRMVVTVEADGVEQSMERLQDLEALPEVLSASLAEYCLEDDEAHWTATVTRSEPAVPDSQNDWSQP